MKANFSSDRNYRSYIQKYGYEYYERLKKGQQVIACGVTVRDSHPTPEQLCQPSPLSPQQAVAECFAGTGAASSLPAQGLAIENPAPEDINYTLQESWPSAPRIISDAEVAQPQQVRGLHNPLASSLKANEERRGERLKPFKRKDNAQVVQSLLGNVYTEEATLARIIRQSGGKDRHSKVFTSKGPRDRRVRLSVPTAIQFYDVQDRLGFDQPSKAVEWLIKKAKSAIDELAQLPNLSLKRFKVMQNHDPSLSPSKHKINGSLCSSTDASSPSSKFRKEDEKGASIAEMISRESGLLSSASILEKSLHLESPDCWNELESSQFKQQHGEHKEMAKTRGSYYGKPGCVQVQSFQNLINQIQAIDEMAAGNSLNVASGSWSSKQTQTLQHPKTHVHRHSPPNSLQHMMNGCQKPFHALLPHLHHAFENPLNSGAATMSDSVGPTAVQQQCTQMSPLLLALQENCKAYKLPVSSYINMPGYTECSGSLASDYGVKNDDSFMLCVQERKIETQILEEKPNRGNCV